MDRVKIGSNFKKQPDWKILMAIPLVYIPIITTIPFVVIGVLLVRIHLKYVGAMDIKSYWDFVPSWVSHRYRYSDQITISTARKWYNFTGYKFSWIFNCKIYCPLSVALFKYAAYLVEVVENWWCPFAHDQKEKYREGAIDKSYWHICDKDRNKLHPEDRDNPIWNEDAEKNDKAASKND